MSVDAALVADIRRCDLVKTCDHIADQSFIQLESLILAQNERWRQA